MKRFRLISDQTNLDFMRRRLVFFAFSAVLGIASIGLYFTNGLNFGIDFAGGTMIEVQTPGAADLGGMRRSLGELGLGEVQLQEFGADNDVLIRVEEQPGGAEAQNAVVLLIKDHLSETLGTGIDFRRTEFVGPKVGAELIQAGIMAVVFSVLAMLIFIWFRFELPFGIGSVIALVHDVVVTIGMFALIGLEFNLSTVAALLLIVGYSMNDTVVVYDRVRENLRKYKSRTLPEILNRSVNDTLSRTVVTSGTTLLALAALFIFGGEVIRGFCFAMIWGILVGTYSSIFIAAPFLIYLGLRPASREDETEEGAKPS